MIQLKIACDKDPNPQGKLSKECVDLIDEKDWDEIDKEKENTNEEINDGSGDSSSNND